MSGNYYFYIGPTEAGHNLTFDDSGVLAIDGTPVGGGGGSGLPYQTFVGSPVGVVTPTAAGYIGQATDTQALYYAWGATADDWTQIAGAQDGSAIGFSADTAGDGVVMSGFGANSVGLYDNTANGLTIYEADTGGIHIHDVGSGGISISNTSSGPIHIEASTGGILISDASDAGIIISESQANILIETTNLAGGITIQTEPSSDGDGITLNDQGTGGITIAGTLIEIASSGGSGLSIFDNSDTGIVIEEDGPSPLAINATNTGGITINDSGGGTDTIILPGFPTSDPSVAGQLFSLNDNIVLSGYIGAGTLYAIDGAIDSGSPPSAHIGPLYEIAGIQTVSFTAGAGTLTFPTAFPNGLLAIVANDVGTASVVSLQVGNPTATKTHVTLFAEVNGTPWASTLTISYIAKGY